MEREYDMTQDKRIEFHYRNDMDILGIIGYPERPYKAMWMWVAELLTECFNPDRSIPAMNDCMGVVMHKVKGINSDCSEILSVVEDNEQEYVDYCELLHISKKLDECGRYYQDIISSDRCEQKEGMLMALKDYSEVIAPFIFKEAAIWTSIYMDDIIDIEKQEEAKKAFKSYCSKYKGLIKELSK